MANINRINGIIDRVSNAENIEDINWILGEPVINLSESVVDRYVETNAKFQAKAGIQSIVKREMHGETCEWCRKRAGSFIINEDDLPDGFWARHENCDCTITYRGDKMKRSGKAFINKKYEEQKYKRKIKSLDEAKLSETISKTHLSIRTSAGFEKTIKEDIGYISLKKKDEAISSFINTIKNEKKENAIIIGNDGKITLFRGKEDTVNIFDVDLKNSIVIHNHPDINGIVSFGKDDFEFLKEHQNIDLFICCNRDFEYTIEIIKNLDDVIYNSLYEEALSRAMIEPTGFEIQDETMKILSEKGYIKYVKRRIN